MNGLHHPCQAWAESISLSAAGCLSSDEQRDVDRHLETCPSCLKRFEQLTALCHIAAESPLHGEDAGAAIVRRVISAVDGEKPQRHGVGWFWRWTAAGLRKTVVDPQQPIPLLRRVMTVKSLKISAGVVTTTAAVLLLVLAFTPSSPTFADAVKCLREARTLSYVWTFTFAKDPENPRRDKVYCRDDGRSRIEHQDGTISIADGVAEKCILLNPEKNQATLGGTFGFTFIPDNQPASDPIRLIAEKVNKPTKELGEKMLDGREVKGFLWSEGNSTCTIWIDKSNAQPVLVEESRPQSDSQILTTRMSEFHINPDIDNAMFSTEVPPGYTVRQPKEPKDKGPVLIVKSNKEGVEDRIYGEKDLDAGRERLRNLSKEQEEGVTVFTMSGNNVQSGGQVNPPKK